MSNKKRSDWISRWTVGTAEGAWMLANALDVFSVLFVVQMGSQPLFLVVHHVAEYFVIYAGMRLLGALALALLAVWLDKRWPSWSRAIWSTLTVCSLATAVFAWLRLYQ